MIHITEGQVARFADRELKAFINELVIHQYQNWNKCRGYNKHEVTCMVDNFIRNASIHGFSSRYEIASFVDISVFIKEATDHDRDKVSKILEESEKTAISRINDAEYYIENMDAK